MVTKRRKLDSLARCFPVGAEVEVKISSDGFYDSWYEAKVLESFVKRYVKYKVQYLTLLSDDDGLQLPLVEKVSAKNVRPRAPPRVTGTGCSEDEDDDPNFELHDLVEAYHNDGWWHGVVSGLRDPESGLFTVSFPNSREVFQFKPTEIRPKLAFVNGKWVPVLGEEQTKEFFKRGDNVEVYRLREDYGPSYFPAQVEEVIHNSYYLVKYESPYARPNGDLTEILDPQYLRPAIDRMHATSRFMAGFHVEVLLEGGWSPGIVLSCQSGSDYTVTLESDGEPMTVHFDGSNLRLRLYWNGRRWSKWGSLCKEKKIKSVNSSKINASHDVSLAGESETTPDSVTYTGKKRKKEMPGKIKKLQNTYHRKVTPRICYISDDDDVAEISKEQLVNPQPLDTSGTIKHIPESQGNFSKPGPSRPVSSVGQDTLQPLMANLALTLPNPSSTSKFNKHTSGSNTPIKPVTSEIVPFEKTSPIWKPVEALEVFSRIPQTPHFMKLESKCKEEREGKAIGMMVTYTNLVESIQRLQIHTDVTVFEEKLTCLISLEENGFIVDPIRSRLQELLAIKTKDTKSALRCVELETALANQERKSASSHASDNGYEAELEDIRKMLDDLRKSIAELEEKVKAVMKGKGAGVLSSITVAGKHTASRLRKEISGIDRLHELNMKEFECVRSKPLT